jgi:hypothetical protein
VYVKRLTQLFYDNKLITTLDGQFVRIAELGNWNGTAVYNSEGCIKRDRDFH